MTHTVRNLSAAEFDQAVGESSRPVLVDFYADWCGPCRVISPVVAELASDYADRADVRQVDVEAEPSLAARFRVRSIPTLLLFKDGVPRETFVGVVAKTQLAAALDKHAA